MTHDGPLLRRSSGPLFRKLLAAAALLGAGVLVPAAAQEDAAGAVPPSLGIIELDLGYGFSFPPGSSFLATDPTEGGALAVAIVE